MKKLLVLIGLIILVYGLYQVNTFESAYEYEGVPRYLAAFGRMGEFDEAHPHLTFITAFVPSVLFAIAIGLKMMERNKEAV